MECKELERAWELAKIDKGGYYIEKDLLYHKDKFVGETIAKLVVPKVKREGIVKSPPFSFLLSLQEESIGFVKNFDFQFSLDLYVLEGPDHDLMVFRKCLSLSLSVTL